MLFKKSNISGVFIFLLVILKLWQATNRHFLSRTDVFQSGGGFSVGQREERIFDVIFFSGFSHASS